LRGDIERVARSFEEQRLRSWTSARAMRVRFARPTTVGGRFDGKVRYAEALERGVAAGEQLGIWVRDAEKFACC